MPIALIVDYELHEGKEQAFAERLREHALATLKENPGCLRFEVNFPLDDEGKRKSGHVVLNELYRDYATVVEHRKSPRLAKMREDTAPLVKGRVATLCEVI
jgi:quinol monooxygenase YgiN